MANQERLVVSVVEQRPDGQRPDDLAEAVARGEDGDCVRHVEFGAERDREVGHAEERRAESAALLPTAADAVSLIAATRNVPAMM
jgi:hypothetical protein